MAEVLDVQLNNRLVGTITRLPDDRNVFSFEPEYIASEERPTLSLSFKDEYGGLIREHAPTQTRLHPFFSNLLPEGTLREYLARRARVKSQREFFLAWALGCDLPGAVQIISRDGATTLPPHANHDTQETSSDASETVLRFSLAGVQLKFSAVQNASGGLTIPAKGVGGSWIAKLPSLRFAGVPENEYAMMELARRVGIDVPDTKLIPIRKIGGLPSGIELAGDVAFAIKRFDRGPRGEHIHMEDFAQVFGVYPEDKYEKASYGNLARVLAIETGQAGVMEFVRRIAFNALIGNADMHLKNWSLIYPDGRSAQLSPAYDFVATIAYLPDTKMALSLAGQKTFASLTQEQFVRFAEKALVPAKIILDTMRETVERFAHEWRNAGDAIDGKLRATIDRHLATVPLWKGFGRRR